MKKPKNILLIATLVFLIGIGVAYYNTSMLLYDRANIISFDDESVKIFEWIIDYEDIKKIPKYLKNLFPKENITIGIRDSNRVSLKSHISRPFFRFLSYHTTVCLRQRNEKKNANYGI